MSIKTKREHWPESFTSMTSEHKKDDLRIFLRKLGIKSARTNIEITLEMMQHAMLTAQANYGMPDSVLMNPRALADLKRSLK